MELFIIWTYELFIDPVPNPTRFITSRPGRFHLPCSSRTDLIPWSHNPRLPFRSIPSRTIILPCNDTES